MRQFLLPPHLRNRFLFCCGLFIFIILVDQLSKYWVISNRLFPIYFNDAIAFSLPIAWYLPWVIIGVVLLYLLYTNRTKYFSWNAIEKALDSTHLRIALPLIAGGGISNIIDRIFHGGSVVDFIDLKYWPVFNLADSAIVIGVFLIIYHLYQKKGVSYGQS